MAAIDQIISVNITAATTAVATESFGVPLIVGGTKSDGAAKVNSYLQPADLLDDGYASTDDEYVAAVAMYSQTLRPTRFLVAKRSASGALADDLAAIDAIDNSWYCAVFTGLADADILAAATAIEGMVKIAGFVSDSVAVTDKASKDDVLTQFAAKGFDRSFFVSYLSMKNSPVVAGIVGGQLPKDPGSSAWGYKPVKGVSVDKLTGAQAATVAGTPVTGQLGKHGNVYINVGGVNAFYPGVMASGTFIDTRIGTDSLTSTIKVNLLQLVVDNEKIPYTEGGCVLIESAIRAAITKHQGYGFLDTDPATISVTHTPVAMVSATQRAQRLAPPFAFQCRTVGGMQGFTISGTINV